MIINTIKLTGLMLFIGGPLYYTLVWIHCVNNEFQFKSDPVYIRIGWISLIGGSLYLLSELISGIILYSGGQQLVISANYINLILVPLFILCFQRLSSNNQTINYGCLIMLGLTIVILHSTNTHAAAQPGYVPFISNIVHLITVCTWGGGLIIFSLLPWSVIKNNSTDFKKEFTKLIIRFSDITILMLVFILISGAILSVSNVHSIAALDGTLYGKGLKIKIILSILLLCFFIFDLLKTGTKLRDIINENTNLVQAILKKYRILISIKTAIIVVILLITGFIANHETPDTPPFLNPQALVMTAENYPLRIDMQPVSGSSNSVRFELYLPDELMRLPSTLVNFNLYLPETQVGIFDGEALQVSQNSFQGEATFPLPGLWRLELHISQTGGSPITGTINVDIPAQPLVDDLRTYLSISSIAYNSSNQITFTVGLLLLITYGWIILRGRQKNISQWTVIAGLTGIAIAIYLILTVTLVKTYPSTYWDNPQPYTASIINGGEVSYIDHCGDCHGQNGRGHGPWAIENRGMIPDLSSPHMDIHTDGEIYWWITHGIPSLEMPPLHEEIIEMDRWAIINYIRSLRHGIPE